MAHPLEAPLALPSPSPPLLRLDPAIRQRIYRYLGLASWDNRLHSFNLRGGWATYKTWTRHRPRPSCFHGLLLSCRAIYTETAALLYSNNQFLLDFSQPHVDRNNPATPWPHHALLALTKSSLGRLSSLKIVINQASCHQLTTRDYTDICCLQSREDNDWLGLHWCRRKHHGAHQLPHLSPASPGTCSDEDAQRGAQALLNEWHSVAARLFSHGTPGRLALSLVCDIRPNHPQALVFAKSFVAPIQLLSPSHLRECHFRLAKTLDGPFQQLAQDAVSQACGIPRPSSEPPASTTTTLVTLPRELRIRILEYTDLVAPRRQAKQAGSILRGDWAGPPVPADPYPYERFAVSEFLRDVVPTPALAHLRFLEVVFPPYRAPSWPETQHPAMQDWRATVDWLRDKANSPGLTLRLIVAEVDSYAPGTYHRTIPAEDGQKVMAAIMDLLHPLTRLAADRGLARFYAHFPYPWECTEESRLRALRDRYWVWREKQALKERAERYVMGGRYENLYADGKEEPKPSDWQVIFYED